MPLSELEAVLAEPVPQGETLTDAAARYARALASATGSETCEIWLWRSRADGERVIELAACWGPATDDNELASNGGEWSVGSPQQLLPPADGRQCAHLALGAHGFATLVRVGTHDPAVIAAAASSMPALARRLVALLPREELEASHRWLLARSDFDRRTATRLAGARSVEELGSLIEAVAEELFPIEYSGIYFVDPASGRLRLVYAKGLSETERASAERTAEMRHPGAVVRTGRAVEVEDTEAQADPHEPPGHGRYVRSRMYLPVRIGGKVVGTIGFAASKPASFGRRHHQVLAFLCDLAGITYARLRAQRENDRRGALIEAAATANERLLAALDWQVAATAALAMVGRAIDAETLALVRTERDHTSEQLDFVWQPVFGAPWARRDRVARLEPAEIERLARGLSIEVEDAHTRALVMLKPIAIDGALWGVLACELAEHSRAAFGRAERAALRGLANGFVSAIARARMDAELRERQKVDAVSKLASGIAHDFNNLLWPVLLYTEMLERGSGIDERGRQMLRDMRRSATRASELVQQVFAVSRSRDRVLQVIDVAEIAIEVSTAARRTAPGTVRLHDDIDSEAGHVLGEEETVRQTLMQVLAHSVEAIGPAGGAIRFTLRRVERDRGSWIQVEVADDAAPFRSGQTQLDAVQRLIAELGGELAVSHASPRGNIREVLLPIALREPGATEPAAQSVEAIEAELHRAEATAADAERILLVDDDGAVLEVARQILESLGYEVIGCSSAERALMVLRDPSVRIALLLTDLSMPGMDGLSLAREAKRLRPPMPVVCCTGFGDARAERTAAEIGVAAFIRKPIDFDHYAKTIRAAIDGSQRG